MKKVLLGLALCAFAFASCGDDNKENNGNGNTTSLDATITGNLKIVEWSYNGYSIQPTIKNVTDEVDEVRGGVYDELVVLCSAPVSNGQFTLKLPTPSSKYLNPIGLDYAEEISVSDKNAMGLFFEMFSYKGDEEVGLTYMFPSNLAEETTVEYIYVDRDVTVKGIETVIDEGYKYTLEYNVDFKKGWNTVILKGSGNKYSLTTGSIPTGMFWGVETYSLDDLDYTKKTRRFKSFRK